eukprot:CAMPEP_0179135078 /NCGR_PEP_ID=MMETSP0796-20121207/64301_1 /TAXON_ID=73915 /ORGANISM="Pyrodinium bahamense, Strain pbaha01" /LENGTH=299 /DNA_ID=CAMNT_0020834091 /DNA_START=57 /DNA_END=956 /DNA_ORIENTATION=+
MSLQMSAGASAVPAVSTDADQPACYTHGYHKSVVNHHATRTAENSAHYLLPHLHKGQHLLDVGCGPGSITAGLADYVERVTGTDVSEEVLAKAREAAAGKENVCFTQGSVYDLPFPDDTFDVVCCHQVLQHLKEPVGAIREMLRVVKPGGLVAAREAIGSTYQSAPHCAEFNQWRELYASVSRSNGAQPDAGIFLESWMLQAGLEPECVRYQNSVVTYSSAHAEARRAYCTAWVVRALHSSFARQAKDYGLADSSDLEAISQAWAAIADDPRAIVLYVNGEVLGRKRRGEPAQGGAQLR